MSSIYPFEMIFLILVIIFFLITIAWFLFLLLKKESRKAGKVLLSAFISICAGFVLLISIFAVSAVISLMNIPIEYGLSADFVIAPIIALIIHIILARHLIK